MSSKKCHDCGFINFPDARECKRCAAKLLSARQQEFKNAQATIKRCGVCKSELSENQTRPEEGMGLILILLGLVFAPVLIGLVMIYVGYKKVCKIEFFLECDSCGIKATA